MAASTAKAVSPAPELPQILTAAEVAKYLRVSPRHVNDCAREGSIPGFKLGSIWRFRRESIERLK